MKTIVLDSGPLGQVTHPASHSENEEARAWLLLHSKAGNKIVVPEICDYEVRRELLRGDKLEGLRRLDLLKLADGVIYAPITTNIMLRAAKNWAFARRSGRPTSDVLALDADAILAATASELARTLPAVIVATANTRHLSLFFETAQWRDIAI